jgi:predicted DNA-binding WGR domain protein
MTDALDPATPGEARSRQTLAMLVSKLGALPTDDVVHMTVPLMHVAVTLHAQGKVGDFGPSGIIEADDGSLALARPDGQDPILDFDCLKKVQPQAASALNVVGEYRVTANEAVGYRVDDLLAVTDDDTEIKKPVYLRGYQSWECRIGHHDEVTDVFLIGLVLASLACGLDFNESEDVERFSRARLNLFSLNPQLHPVIATIILETTALNRHERATDLASLAKRLLTYRNQPTGLEVERVLAEAKGAPGRRTAVLGHLRDRLFDLSRRNRLIHFRPTQASVNLTESSVPLVLRIEAIRTEQICVWSEHIANSLLPGAPVALSTWLRFEEHPYLPAALDRIMQETRRDRAEYGFSNLRLVVGFLRWNNLKDAPNERIVSPLLWLPVEVTKRKGVRDQYMLRCLDDEAEFNPALRHFLRQLYDIHLPEKIDLTRTTLDQIHTDLAAQIHHTEPGVRLELQKRPAIRFIHQRAIQRVRQFARRRGGRSAAADLDWPDFSYEPTDYRPLGLALFEKYVRPSPLPQRLAAGGSLQSRPDHMVPTAGQTERTTYALAGDEGHRYAWELDLTHVTLSNFNYKKMSLVRDYNQLIDVPGDQPAFDRVFSIEPRALEHETPQPLAASDYWNVVASDATQDAAVAMARAKRSFIIQGPPGTGKSQTITNLIADYTARAKRVLFVCEKRAALDVVFHRLRQAGLDDLACLIHDSQEDKKTFVADLKGCYEKWSKGDDGLERNGTARDRTLAAFEANLTAIARFDEAVTANLTEAGASIRHMVRRALALPTPEPSAGARLRERLPSLSEWGANRVLIGRVVRTASDSFGFASLAEHPFARLNAETVAHSQAFGLVEGFLGEAESLLAQIDPVLDDDRQAVLSADLTLLDALKIARAARRARDTGLVHTLALLDPQSTISADLGRIRSVLADKLEARANAAAAARGWKEPLSPEDTTAALDQARRQERSFFKFLSGAWRRLSRTIHQRYDFSAHAIKPAVTSVLERLQLMHVADEAWRSQLKSAERQFQTPDFDRLLECRKEFIEALPTSGLLAGLVDRAKEAEDPFASMAIEADCHAPLEALHTLLERRMDGAALMSLGDLGEALRDMHENLEDLPEILSLLTAVHQAGPNMAFVLRTVALPVDEIEALVVDESIARAERADPELRRFDIDRLLSLSRRAGAARDLMRDQNSALIRSTQRHQFLQHVKQANLSVTQLDNEGKRFKKRYATGRRELEHEFGKTMRYRSIRELTGGDTGLVVSDLKPIWLMSPLSVSDTLPLEGDLFDVVIFDEASQIPIEEAVPALARAPQVIVVGDEMQLPPTSFFSASLDDDEKQVVAEEDGETVAILLDADSLLNQSARHLPATLLAWHYRSRSESLISFSNAAFYDGRLVTIPDRNIAQSKAGSPSVRSDAENIEETAAERLLSSPITMHRIADGLYEARANQPEARYIAELVRELLRRKSGLSIGVVAFSEAQQDEIENALEALSSEDDAFADLLDREYAREDDGQFNGLFVKNLENVQGDERDIVILSICYAPGRDGRMAMNFGPINQRGGEKRLNVIFSRARHHMAVVTTIGPETITNIHNDGARALLTFLAFVEAQDRGEAERARTILSTLNPDAERAFSQNAPIDSARTSLAAALRARGHLVDEHVGSASLRCDLAIADKAGREYALGILLDREAEQANINERFVFRPGILRAFGWRIIDVPSTRWLRDPDGVLTRIEAELLRDSWNIQEADPLTDDTASLIGRVPGSARTPNPKATAPAAPAAPPASVPVLAEFRFQQDVSSKFWKIGTQDCDVTVVYGRIGTKGQTVVKTFATPSRATSEVAKLIAEKTRKGYVRVAD